jgi:AcrR family transcriptional regulator
VTVRELAAGAGVSHAPAHRYLGIKTDIVKAVLARNENAIHDAAAREDDLHQAVSLMLHEGLTHHRACLRLLVYSALRDLPFDHSLVSFGATERLIELARPAASDAEQPADRGPEGSSIEAAETDRRLAVAMVVALLLGWAATEPWVVKATGVKELDDEIAAAALEEAALAVIDRLLPDAS